MTPSHHGSEEQRKHKRVPRQCLPKGTDMSALTQTDLDKATHSLNGRPRRTLHGMSPSEKLTEVLQ